MTSYNVLVVDDNSEFVERLRTFEGHGSYQMNWIGCPSIVKAIEKVHNTENLDLIIIDLCMDDSFGLSGVVALKYAVDSKIMSIPIIAVAALEQSFILEIGPEVIKAGAEDCIAKDMLQGSTLFRILRFGIERNRSKVDFGDKKRKDCRSLIRQITDYIKTSRLHLEESVQSVRLLNDAIRGDA